MEGTCRARWPAFRCTPPDSWSYRRPHPTQSAAASTSAERVATATGLHMDADRHSGRPRSRKCTTCHPRPSSGRTLFRCLWAPHECFRACRHCDVSVSLSARAGRCLPLCPVASHILIVILPGEGPLPGWRCVGVLRSAGCRCQHNCKRSHKQQRYR